MECKSFVYWLQGFFELSGLDKGTGLTGAQTDAIRNHLNMVFLHDIDPSAGPPEHQEKLDAAHQGKPIPITPSHILRC